MNRRKVLVSAAAMSLAILYPLQGSEPFEIMETTIDQVLAAYKSGRLTARQLVQGYLERINAYDQKGPKINSIITLNPKALEEADKNLISGTAGQICGIRPA